MHISIFLSNFARKKRAEDKKAMSLFEKTYRVFKKSAITLTIIFAVLLLDKLLSLFTENIFDFSFHQYGWPLILMQIYRTLVAGSLVGGLACWIVVLILWLIRYLHKQKQLPSRLCGVNQEQEDKILRLLKQAATSRDGTGKMNRSEVANFLATLKALGHLEDGGDYNNLRLWVEQVTGTHDADKGHFNEAYKRALDKKGDSRYTSDLKFVLGIA